MMIESYFRTEDSTVDAAYKIVLDAYQTWFERTNKVCRDEGFEGFSAHDFCVPDLFLRSAECHIQRVPGFRQYKDQGLIIPDNTIPFALRTDHEHGTAVFNQLSSISKAILSSLAIEPVTFGCAPFGFSRAVFIILGIPYEARLNGLVGYSQLWALENQHDAISFVCSIPITGQGTIPVYENPHIATCWKPVTGSEVVELFNTHNMKMRTTE